VRDGDRLSFFVVDGNDATHRPQPIVHGRSSTFGPLSKAAPIMTKAMRLLPLTLLHPCQLPSCTTTSPAFITTLPWSRMSVRSPPTRIPYTTGAALCTDE